MEAQDDRMTMLSLIVKMKVSHSVVAVRIVAGGGRGSNGAG